jgi:outer membrane protein assembly factor BamB
MDDTKLAPSWTFSSSYGVPVVPLVVAGDRLLGITGSTVFAADIYTKLPAPTPKPGKDWFYPIDAFDSSTPKVATADGVVYITDGDELKAFGLGDRVPLQGWKPPSVPDVAALTVQDNTLVVVHLKGGATAVSGYNARTGQPSFKPRTFSSDSPGSVAYGSGALFFMAEGSLHAVNVDFGDPRWKFEAAGDFLTPSVTPVVADRTVLVSGRALYALDIDKGTKRFEITSTSSGDVSWYPAVADIPAAPVAASRAASFHVATPLFSAVDGAQLSGVMLSQAVLGRTYGGCAVASNTAGDIVCFALSDGSVLWRKKVDAPGAPTIIDGTVYVPTNRQSRLARFNLITGIEESGYLLPDLAPSQPPVIVNGHLFLTTGTGDIVAYAFGKQSAAYFDGKSSMISVKPDGKQFDFGTDDFTIEAWFRSSTGGEIFSSYPTSGDANAHGIRINLTPEGQIRVAVTNTRLSSVSARRTNRTGAADGEWHHVAVVRRDGAFMIALDGFAHEVRAKEGASDVALPIGGDSALTFGAYVASKDAPAESYFRGLIREVRIWDRALDVSTIANNKNVILRGSEPRLKGLWRLGEVHTPGQPADVINEVRKHRVRATFVNAASRATDLTMDSSAYPYLLHESLQQWPYAGTWAARGVDRARGSAAVSSNGIAAYATGGALYAVNGHDGKRVWAMEVTKPISDPVADGGDFLVVTSDGLIRLDARRGGKLQHHEFPVTSSGQPVAPACSGGFVAATMGGSEVWVWDRIAPRAKSVTVTGTPERLVFGSAGLAVISRDGAGVRLTLIDPAAATVRGTATVSASAVCMAGDALFAVVDGTVARFEGANLGAGPTTRSEQLSGRITGLAALVDESTIVATTAAGVVHGLTLGGLPRWKSTLPVGRAGGASSVNPPAIDRGRRIVCTTTSGTVALIDGRTGSLTGLYSTMHGAIDTPAIMAGTVFTGCVDVVAAANDDLADIDGALHSIVFGDTTVMRLNLDSSGKPVPNGAQHGVIDMPSDHSAIRLLNAHESCVEAWVNIPKGSGGGGIVGITPTKSSRFDVNAWIEPNGLLHYVSRVLDGSQWGGVHVTAATDIIDGKWHHIALSRSLASSQANDVVPDRVIVYVDGKAVPTTILGAPAAPPKLTTGLHAFLGATFNDQLAAQRPLCGMLAEVRVWDTYLVATEVSSRMNVKLRGDEPGLVAYWNFDLGRVADTSRERHDGQLALEATHPVWWLSDITFTQPSYPFVTSTAAIASEKPGEATTYNLVIKVSAADGKGMKDQEVHGWYVRRAEDDPDTITVDGQAIQVVTSDDEPHPKMLRLQRAFSGKTRGDGTLRLKVKSTRTGHGPALDLWTQFMPLNERFHVDVLVDNQKLERPAPPALTAQAKLIQDYHYTTGNAVDDSRSRSTWRVVLRASDAGDISRPGEPITLWASQSTTVEVLGVKHTVSADNAASLETDQTGELTVIMSASELTAPTLYARAGFMHRNDRVVIDAHQDTHAQLNKVDAHALTAPKMTNWKKGDESTDSGPTLLRPEHAPYSGDIATAIRQVTTIATPADPHAPPRSGRLLRAPRGTRVAMRQPQTAVSTDGVVLRRTLAGVNRPAPVDTEGLRHALGGTLGFTIDISANSFVYKPITTHAELAAIHAAYPPTLEAPDHLLGSIWDDIADFATDVYNRAKQIVVSVAESVQNAIITLIDEAGKVVSVIVDSIDKALDAVAGFFNRLLVELEKVIEFLRVIFNWKAIIDTSKILKRAFNTSCEQALALIKDSSKFTGAIASLAGQPMQDPPRDAPSLNTSSDGQGNPNDPVLASSRSVEGKSMMQKTTSATVSSEGKAGVSPALPPDPADALIKEVAGLAGSIFDLSPGDLVSELRRIISKALDTALIAAGQTLATVMKTFAEPMKWVFDLLNAKIEIPFISALYKWITTEDLTLANVVCLVLAIPVNIAYAALTLIKDGRAKKFSDDAGGLFRSPASLATVEADGVPATPIAPEVIFVVFRVITGVADSTLDKVAVAQARVKAGTGAGFLANKAVAIFKILSGVAGMVTLTIQAVYTNKAFEDRVRKVAGKDADQFLPPWEWLTWTVYGILMCLRLKNIVVGGLLLRSGPSDSSKGVIWTEYILTQLFSRGAVALLIVQSIQVDKLKPVLDGFGNANVAKEYQLLAIRDIMSSVSLMFEMFFSAKDLTDFPGSDEPSQDMHSTFLALRAYSTITAIVLHSVAVFHYGD